MLRLAFIFAASTLLVLTAKAKFDPYPAVSGEFIASADGVVGAAPAATATRVD